jgi:hypothetical protein
VSNDHQRVYSSSWRADQCWCSRAPFSFHVARLMLALIETEWRVFVAH